MFRRSVALGRSLCGFVAAPRDDAIGLNGDGVQMIFNVPQAVAGHHLSCESHVAQN